MYSSKLNRFTPKNPSFKFRTAAPKTEYIPLPWLAMHLIAMGVVADSAVKMPMSASCSIPAVPVPVPPSVSADDDTTARVFVAPEFGADVPVLGAVAHELGADAHELGAVAHELGADAHVLGEDAAELAAAQVAAAAKAAAGALIATHLDVKPAPEEKTKGLYAWVLLNCTLSTRNIGLLLLAGGLVTMALTLSCPPIAIAAAVVAGVGALMVAYSFFKHRAPVNNTNRKVLENDSPVTALLSS